jgi:hypothetical protein
MGSLTGLPADRAPLMDVMRRIIRASLRRNIGRREDSDIRLSMEFMPGD